MMVHSPLQGVRPAGLGKVASRELAEFIAVCIRPKEERPRSRQLLKHPYFDSIRERATARAEALSATASQVHTCLVSAELFSLLICDQLNNAAAAEPAPLEFLSCQLHLAELEARV